MLHITTWLWGDAYGEHYVTRLAAAVRRNLKQEHRFICFTDRRRHLSNGMIGDPNLPGITQYRIPNMELTKVKGCFARLALFDPTVQASIGIRPGDRVVNLDLDMVITGELDPLFDRDDEFTILQGINSTNPCPYNGSAWMFRAGATLMDVWLDFSLENYAKQNVPFHSFPDDQGWFHYKMPNAGKWGPADGVYGFKKIGWDPNRGNDSEALPKNARIVAFPGWRDPSKFTHLPWVAANWQ